MAPKVFLTGVTGYIGGTVHAYLARKHADWEFTVLVRSEDKAKKVRAAYPGIQVVIGGLDDRELVTKAAAEADIVIHTADSSDHVGSAEAIAAGLASSHSSSNPGYWLHLSGTSILTWRDARDGREGQPPLPEETYHDDSGADGVGRLQTLPDEAHHRNVDKIVQAAAAADPSAVRVAIVCPPTIYGVGSGSVSTRSVQAPDLVATTLARGTAPIVGPPGLTEWDNVHIDDLADLYVRLAEATQDPALQGNPEVFGIDGYFFAGTGVHTWADLARWAADQAHKDGYLAEAKTEYVSIAQVASGSPTAPSWGRNSKGVARRAARVLGWAPGGKASIETEVRELVEREAKANGVKKV